MDNGNHLLDEFLAKVQNTPLGEKISVPWSNFPMDDSVQAEAAALIKFGIIGLGIKPSGKMNLYLGRGNVGNPFYRLLSGWLLYVLLTGYLAALVQFYGRDTVAFSVSGAVFSALGFLYFWPHFRAAWRYSMLLNGGLSRGGELTRLGVLTIGAMVSAGAVLGFIGRIIG